MSRSRSRWLLPLIPLPILALLAFGLTRDAMVLPSAITGERAPQFRLPTMTGDTLALAQLSGQIVVLNFWASWCIPCRQEHPALLRATRDYPAERVRVVGVLYQDTEPGAQRFMDRFGGDWTTVLDDGSRTAIDYGVYGVPETFFIGADGMIARKHIGPVDWEIISSTVDSLLTEMTAAVPAGTPGGP